MKAIKSTDVWVIYKPTENTEIKEIFLNKEDADVAFDELCKEKYSFYRKHFKTMSTEEYENWYNSVLKYNVGRVTTLTEALEQIVEYAEERFVEHGPEY
jgi:hypothetical protein